ncbi:MAG: fibronectin type III domain-containing protein, partial [Clostridia bacterium]|nr:fibronectin type III domain-containing protein [Clostridia bacterium]
TADGWWAGIKVVAPAGLTEDELKEVKYRRLDKDGWTEAKSFWNAKDSKEGDSVHWMGAWLRATPELIASDDDGMLVLNYEFDWYGNGFDGEVQKINFVLDTEKLVLDSEYNYGTIEGITEGLVTSGETDMTITNEDEITLDFSLADASIGRYQDAWWIGVKILAPENMTSEALKDAKYCLNNGTVKSFWQLKDSDDSADRHFITAWLPVTQEYIDNDADGIFNWTYEFDWDGNGFGISTQKFTVSVDANKINRIHSAGCTKVIDKPAKEPECLVDGNTEASHCGVCGLTISVEEVIPAYGGHNFTEKIMDEAHLFAKADCVYYDRYYYSCSRCDVMSEDTYEDTEGSVLLPHERTAKIDDLHLVSPADCLNAAIYYEGCKNCDTVFKDTTFSVGDPKYHLFTVERVTTKAGIGKSGYISFYCKDCGTCDNSPIPLPAVTSIKLGATSYNYTGKAVTPGVIVTDAKGKTLKAGTDYTVAYANNIVPGTATAKVTLRGNYTGSYTLNYKIVVPVTSKVTFASNTSAIKLAWNAVSGAAGYAIYVKNGNGWRLLGTTSNLSVTYSNLPQGTKYTFAVKAGIRYNGRVYWATSYKTINTATTAPATAKIVTSQNTSAIRLTWSAVKGANGYALYLKTSAGWKHLYNTANTTALFTNLKAGTNYIYAVRSITVTASNQYLLGGFREYIAATLPVAPTVNVSVSGGKATIRWNKVAGATGYQVYYKTATGSYVLIKTVGNSVTSITDSGYTAGKNYNFAVRAYKAVSGGYVFGALGGRNVTMK